MRSCGFSTIEVLVSLGLLLILAAATGTAVAHSSRALAASRRASGALEVAVETLEILRAGERSLPALSGEYRRDWSITPRTELPGLLEARVTVRWDGGGGRELSLAEMLLEPRR